MYFIIILLIILLYVYRKQLSALMREKFGGIGERDLINLNRTVTFHYTDWCRYCKEFKPVWGNIKRDLSSNGITFKEINEDVAKTPGVSSYPTIRMLGEDGRMYEYKGTRNFNTLREWIVRPIL